MTVELTTVVIDFELVLERLKARIENDGLFKAEVDKIVNFYGTKLVSRLELESEQLAFAEMLEDVLYAQLAHGYYLMLNALEVDKLLQQEATEKEQEYNSELNVFWETSPGVLLNAQGLNMPNIIGGNTWFKSPVFNAINRQIINEFYAVHALFEIVSEEISTYGSYLSILDDERYQYKKVDESAYNVTLANPFEIHFITPQVFMQYEISAENVENWLLYSRASSGKESNLIGTVTLKTFPNFEGEREGEGDSMLYILDIAIENTIVAFEQRTIYEELIKLLSPTIQENLKIRFSELTGAPILFSAADITNTKF